MEFNCRTIRSRMMALSMFCVSSAMGWAQISLVNVTNCGAGAFPGITCTIPATGSGNLIVVGWEMVQPASGVNITGITDNAGNVYSEAGAARASYAAASVDIWYAKNSAAGATSLTIQTSSAVTNAGAVIWEFSGVDQTAPLDVSGVSNNQASSATPVSPSLNTTGASDVIVALIDLDNQVTGISPGNAFTNDSTLMSNGFAHLITSSAGANFAQWNQAPAGAYASSAAAFKAAAGGPAPAIPLSKNFSACDLNRDGVVNSTDVNLAINMALGTSTCTASVEGPLNCSVVTVQRVVNASQGQACIAYNTHGVTLNWAASNSPNIAGYNVYRGASASGPFTKLNSALVTATTYVDSSVQAGQSYVYVATTVNTSGQESSYSTPISGVIPIP